MDHFCKAQIKYIFNYLSHLKNAFKIPVLAFSIDDKAKIKIGTPAVSRYVHSRKYFELKNEPKTPDHDFPIGSKMLIIPSGNYLNKI